MKSKLIMAAAFAFMSVFGFVFGLMVLPDAGPAVPEKPNIILIMADDLGYGDLGSYGQLVIRTPSMDRMASEGMRFTQAYAGSSVCAPSRCALMTGMHTGHAYVRGNKRLSLPDEIVTIPEVLRTAGYATAMIGKWGLGNKGTSGIPNLQGFDEWFGFLDQAHAHTYYPEFLWRNREKVFLEGNVESQRNVAVERTQYSHDLFTEEALKYIEGHREGPFFLYLPYTIPHANNERGNALGDGMETPDYGAYADEDWPAPQKGHAAMISRLDRDVGRILDLLGKLGIDDETLVVFTSDNGTHREGGADPEFFDSSGPLRGYKRALYEGGIRVPAIARWPGVIEAGSVSDHVWAFWDALPTLADLAGANAPEGLDGISFLPALLGEGFRQREHEYLYWEFHERDFLQAVRKGDWKAVRSRRQGTLELFDLRRDLGETHDLAQDYHEKLEKFEIFMGQAHTPSENWVPWIPSGVN
jgi:arylsulfatase A-like enzyme